MTILPATSWKEERGDGGRIRREARRELKKGGKGEGGGGRDEVECGVGGGRDEVECGGGRRDEVECGGGGRDEVECGGGGRDEVECGGEGRKQK